MVCVLLWFAHEVYLLNSVEKKGLVLKIMNLNWKQLLNLNRNEVLGLDIGSSSVRMVRLKRHSNGYAVTAANLTEINPSAGTDIEQSTVEAIHNCISAAEVDTRRVVCSVSGSEVAVRHFKFPPLQPAELEGAIRLEAAQVCPFNIDDGVMDYQVIPNGQDCVRGVFVGATREVIDRRIRLVEKADLACVLIDVNGLALLNCFAEQAASNKQAVTTTAMLDVGTSCTTLAIMGDNKLPFIRNMPYAGRDIISQIADENNVAAEAVYGDLFAGKRPTVPESNLRAGLVRACQKLVTDVNETLRFHTAQEKSSVIEQILLCGGFGTAAGFAEALESGLGIKVVVWNPFDGMQCEVGRQFWDIIQNKGPAMAVAVGLAMRSI